MSGTSADDAQSSGQPSSNLAALLQVSPARSYRSLRLSLPQPWSRRLGQLAYLHRLAHGDGDTRMAFAEEALIEQVVTRDLVLDGIGVGLSERVIEVPWVLRSLPADPGRRVLDVGTAFAPVVYKRLLLRQPHTIEAVDLADVGIPAFKSHVADVRDLPFEAGSFDVATCISTLEHIGMDNAHYNIQSGGGGDVDALRELGRVAGRVLVTVPAGGDEDRGWLRQYAPTTFRSRAEEAELKVLRLQVFAHDQAIGWHPVPEDAVSERRFGEGVYAAAAIICAEMGRDLRRDGA